ncbi:MAG TPA: hypothetical protein VFM46_00935 [Pseudomonadales bacterium]|nr:hypothetical protein [Pseudomonadales bacterium]
MGITLFSDGSNDYYRITKTWGRKERQFYVRIGEDKKAAKKEAETILGSLEKESEEYYRKHPRHGMRPLSFRHEDGSILGLTLQWMVRDERTPTLEFKIRALQSDGSIKWGSVSLGSRDFDEGFKLAVAKVCELNHIPKGAPVYKGMLKAKDFYAQKYKELAED